MAISDSHCSSLFKALSDQAVIRYQCLLIPPNALRTDED